MKAIICKEFGALESLELVEKESPSIKTNELKIKVAACGLNFPDSLILNNQYQFTPELPYIPGGEFTGMIIEVGEDVQNFKVGQRVFGIERWGGLAEELVLPEKRAFLLPDDVSYIDGASLVYNLSTAWYALKSRGKAKPGENILILGAGGGVGLAAIQLSKILGLRVIAAAGATEKLEICKALGADKTINYSQDDLRNRIREYGGVDLVLDTVGGKHSDSAIRSLKWGGRYLVVGFASGEIPKIPLNLALLKGIDIRGVFWGKFSREETGKYKENLQELFHFISEGKIKSYIRNQYGIIDGINALKELGKRESAGKIVVICNKHLVENEQLTTKNKTNKFIFTSKEHILESVGQDLGESNWFAVTQDVIDDFADATFDHQWIHVREDIASKSPIGSTIAHGFLTLSLSPKLLNEIYEMPFVKMGINYGLDKLRFTTPVKVGSKIKMKAKLASANEYKGGGLKLKIEAKYYAENSDKPVCVADLLSIIY